MCRNTVGSFECSCKKGYKLLTNERTCQGKSLTRLSPANVKKKKKKGTYRKEVFTHLVLYSIVLISLEQELHQAPLQSRPALASLKVLYL